MFLDLIAIYFYWVGLAVTVGILIIIGYALILWLQALTDDQDRRQHISQADRIEAAQLDATLAEIRHLPTARGH